jgi:hypothetical protein
LTFQYEFFVSFDPCDSIRAILGCQRSGAFAGMAVGLVEGALHGRSLPGVRLKISSILNAVGRRGSKSANAVASLGVYCGSRFAQLSISFLLRVPQVASSQLPAVIRLFIIQLAAVVYSGASWILNYTETPPPNEYLDTECMRAATSAATAGAFYRLPSASFC